MKGLIGPIMADISGRELKPEDREILRHPLVGGVILFTRNYYDHAQLKALCRELLALKQPRLLIAVDHEGGRVQRFRMGFSRIPAMGSLGRFHREDPAAALAEAESWGATIGRELGGFGIDLCFAPVLDRDFGVSQIIGDRAFGEDIDTIVALASAFRRGLNAEGLAATGKHFPGHGAVAADSHLELPIDRRPLAEIERGDLQPFARMIEQGLESVMMAHVRYNDLDETPASFSRRWIRGVLRRQLGFRGAVFCDDLSMKGAWMVGELPERARLALDAGCDMLPVCNDRQGLVELLDALREVQPRKVGDARLRRLYRRGSPP
ncbi:MAG TPA: beta-N-acetylhexosaminidase [Nevskiaceae bacterium]|nr:beta-N-acetylhexosaminidase [Nevskiaceae bacterium]